MYTATATRLTKNSKGYKILSYINDWNGATKYQCVTNVLGLHGSKSDLRGYYCSTFRGWVEHGVVTLNRKTHEYNITTYGKELLKCASLRSK